MGLIKPRPQPAVPGERAASGVLFAAQAVAALAVLAMLGVLWGWLMSIVADHIGSGFIGALQLLLLVLMGALAVSAVAFGIWAVLQNPWFKQRARARAR